MKRMLALLLALAVMAGLISGCANKIDNSAYVATGDAILMEGEESVPNENEKDSQSLTLAYYPNRSLNPLFGSDYTNRVLMSLMYQGLFAVDNKKNPTPILCSSYRVSADTRTWVFYVENNATFSDGTKVTAEDVAATYAKAKENDYYKHRFYHLHSTEVLDDGGIAFYLDTPYENLPLLLDVPIVKASEVDAAIPLGTGPYVFVSGIGGSHLNRNSSWWCGSLEIPATDESITLVEVSSVAQVRDEFQFGEVSVVCTNPMSAGFAEYRSDYELWEIESGYMMYLGCNITWSEHFDDGTLRTFLTYALDRAAFAEEYFNGMVHTVTLPCSPTEVYYSSALAENYQYDSLKFMDQMRNYKIPKENGAEKVMRLLVNADDSSRVQIARDIAETLTDLGLPCKTMECSASVFKDALYGNNFDIYLGLTRLSPTNDLTEFFRNYGQMGSGGLANETLYSMTLKSLENSGNYYNLYKMLADDGRIIPMIFGYYNVYAQRGLMPNLSPARDNVFYYSMGKNMKDIQQPTEFS